MRSVIRKLNVALVSFLIIASGGVACVMSGIFSQRFGARMLATLALLLSCVCCLASPLFLFAVSPAVFIAFLFFWGLVVIADSPLFSTLVAQSAPPETRGTSLTIVNSVGFSITIVSIQYLNVLADQLSAQYIYMWLAVGPLLGLMALLRNR